MDSRSYERRGLLICAVFLVAGGAFGSFFARLADDDASMLVLEMCRIGIPALHAVVLNLTLPCLTLFFSTSVIGFLFIPLLDFAGGCIASWFMTAILSSYGRDFYAMAYLSVPAFFGAACQLLLSARCMLISLSIGREKRGSAGFGRWKSLIAASAGLIVLTAAEIIFYRFAR